MKKIIALALIAVMLAPAGYSKDAAKMDPKNKKISLASEIH